MAVGGTMLFGRKLGNVEVLHEQELLRLLVSIFSVAGRAGINTTNHTALSLVNYWLHSGRRSNVPAAGQNWLRDTGERVAHQLTLPAQQQEAQRLDHLCLFTHAAAIARDRGLFEVFPRDVSDRRQPQPRYGWTRATALQQIDDAMHTLMVQRMLHEAAGWDHAYDGLHAGAPHGKHVCGPRGAQLARSLLAPLPQHLLRSGERGQLSELQRKAELHLLDQHAALVPQGVAPSLRRLQSGVPHLDRPETGATAQRRAAFSTNRTSLAGAGVNHRMNAARNPRRRNHRRRRRDARRRLPRQLQLDAAGALVRPQHRNDPPRANARRHAPNEAQHPPTRRRPMHCTRCQLPAHRGLGEPPLPPKDTVDHVLTSCNDPAIVSLRSRWTARLHGALTEVRAAAGRDPASPLHRSIQSNTEAYFLMFNLSPMLFACPHLSQYTLATIRAITAKYLRLLDQIIHFTPLNRNLMVPARRQPLPLNDPIQAPVLHPLYDGVVQ